MVVLKLIIIIIIMIIITILHGALLSLVCLSWKNFWWWGHNKSTQWGKTPI